MRSIDKDSHHKELLGKIGFGLKKQPHDAAAREFIDAISDYYLQELPDAVLRGRPTKDGRSLTLTPDEYFRTLQAFVRMVDEPLLDNSPHTERFFEKLPANLYEVLDYLPPKVAENVFSGLCSTAWSLDLRSPERVQRGSSPPKKPLSPSQLKVARMLEALERLSWLGEGTHGVRMGAKIGAWALKGPAYEQATYRIAMKTPYTRDVEACIAKQGVQKLPVDLSGLGLQSLPEGMHTLNYLTSIDLSNNRLERIPMEMADMAYYNRGYAEKRTHQGRIQIDLQGNPLSKMTLEELRRLDDPESRPFGPIFKLPRFVELSDGTRFESSQAVVLAGSAGRS